MAPPVAACVVCEDSRCEFSYCGTNRNFILQWSYSVAVVTLAYRCALHGEGPGFKSQRNHILNGASHVAVCGGCKDSLCKCIDCGMNEGLIIYNWSAGSSSLPS